MNNIHSNNSKLDEFSLKTNINEKLLVVQDKNKFIESKLVSPLSHQLQSQINKNFVDISNILSDVNTNLSQFAEIVNKRDDSSKEKLQLVIYKLKKQLTIETTLYQENKTKYKSLLETISHTDDSTDEVAIQPTKDDIKLSIHNAEKQTHIKEIYEKTVIISKISKDIKEIAHAQEKTIESIENNIQTADTKLIGAKVNIDKKDKENQKEFNNTKKLAFFLISLILFLCLFLYLLSK